ncbi:MAG: murein hydrolase activator EnvC family protein [Bacteroidales bacterium]|jgi:septal ring factor EnvC (AmiA/AmiB activator)
MITDLKNNKFSVATFLVVLLFIFLSPSLQAQTKKDLQAKKSQLEKDISKTNKELDETKKSKSANLKQLVLIKRKIKKREELLETLDTEINSIEKQITHLSDTISKIDQELKDLKSEYSKIIVSTYRNRSASSRLMFIFASKSFNQAFKRLRYLEAYTSYRKEQLNAIVASQNMLASKKIELENTRSSKITLKEKGNAERIKLAQEKEEKDQQAKKLTKKEKELLAKLEKNQKAVRTLQKSIEAIVAEEIRRANEEKARMAAAGKPVDAGAKPAAVGVSANSMSITAEDIALSGSFASNKGRLPSPLDRCSILMNYGEHPHPDFQGIVVKNNGIDFLSVPNADVKAVFEGTVSSVIFIADLNYVVIIRHGNYLSVYSNLKQAYVKKGDKVSIRQTIGVAANQENNANSKLHFELWHGNNVNDPANWLNI